MKERGEEEGQWACLLEECRRKLSRVCKRMDQVAGSQTLECGHDGLSRARVKVMRTVRVGKYLFTSIDKESDEDIP